MYSLPSASQMWPPWPRWMNSGLPPTARKARTGELTPPGMTFCARLKSSSERFMGLGTRAKEGVNELARVFPSSLRRGLEIGHFFGGCEQWCPHWRLQFLHFVVRAVMHTKRDSEFPSWIRRGGCAINKCGEASLVGADGVVDQCCEATL